MNQTEYAAHRGVSGAYISKLVKLGKIPKLADGSIDPDVADAALAGAADPNKAGTAAYHAAQRANGQAETRQPPLEPGVPVGNFNRAKTVDAEYVAKLRELEYKERTGELIGRHSYAKGCEDAAMALGKELDGMIHRLAPVVAGESNVARCRELISAEVFRAREQIANTLEALAADPRDGTRQ
jgi:hypothetical protein